MMDDKMSQFDLFRLFSETYPELIQRQEVLYVSFDPPVMIVMGDEVNGWFDYDQWWYGSVGLSPLLSMNEWINWFRYSKQMSLLVTYDDELQYVSCI